MHLIFYFLIDAITDKLSDIPPAFIDICIIYYKYCLSRECVP